MVRRLLITLTIVGMSVWAQTPKDALAGAEKTEKVDKAAAYYHFTLACLYVRSPGNTDKVSENLKAAIKADPQAPTKIPLRPPSVPITIFQRTPPAPQP
jgi:hypothetical protein